MFNWFKSFRKKESAINRALTLFLPLEQGVSTPTDYASLAREGFSQNSVVFACVKEIATAGASVPWKIFRTSSDGSRKELLDHPLLKLLANPNPLQGRFEFFESVLSYLYLSGNTFIETVHTGQSQTPRELYSLRPDRVRVIPHPVTLVQGYEYSAGGEKVRFPRDRILHMKMFHPLDDFYGLSPIQVAALAINKMNAADQWNSALLQNAAVPSGALVSKERLTEEQFDRLRQEMRDQMQGVRNAREPLLLEQGLDWKELSVNPKDMDWIEGMRISATQIAQIYNVPPELVGLQPATYQNRKEARKALYTEVICPALNRLRDSLNHWLTPKFGADLFLDYSKENIEALSEDVDALWRRARTSDFLTINEKRRLVGFNDIEDGDSLKS